MISPRASRCKLNIRTEINRGDETGTLESKNCSVPRDEFLLSRVNEFYSETDCKSIASFSPDLALLTLAISDVVP
jgi:hypothetical protein